MKKSLIAAGASAVAMAALPMAGVFAAGTIYGSPIVDNFSLTVGEVCTLSRQSTAHTAPTVSSVAGTWDPTGTSTDTFTATLVAGTQYAGLATSNYNVTCNNADDGYQVTVAATDFSNNVSGKLDWKYTAETSFDGTTNSEWFLTSSAKASIAIASGDAVWSEASSTAVTSDDFTITYSFYPLISQQTGTYTATATYTLANI